MLQHLQPSRTGNKINMDHVSTQNQCIFITFPYLWGGGGLCHFSFNQEAIALRILDIKQSKFFILRRVAEELIPKSTYNFICLHLRPNPPRIVITFFIPLFLYRPAKALHSSDGTGDMAVTKNKSVSIKRVTTNTCLGSNRIAFRISCYTTLLVVHFKYNADKNPLFMRSD